MESLVSTRFRISSKEMLCQLSVCRSSHPHFASKGIFINQRPDAFHL